MEPESVEHSYGEYSAKELREAGASELFVRFYQHAPEDARVRNQLENIHGLEKLSESPYLAGGFFQLLWEGRREEAIGTADPDNEEIFDKFL